MSTEPTAVATRQAPKKDLQMLMKSEQFREAVSLALPKHLTPERFVRIALTTLMRVPKLAQCSQESVFKCLLDCSALGLEPDGRRAHLIPYGTDCTLIIDYKGLVELMMRGGSVSNIHADVVCENDEFDYDRGEVIKHRIDFRRPRGKMYAVYCRVTLRDGTSKCEALSKEEVDRIRTRSKAQNNSPWVTDYNEMAKKTACRRVSKWIPLSPEMRDALETDDREHELEQRRKAAAEPIAIDLTNFIPSDDPNRGHDATGDPEKAKRGRPPKQQTDSETAPAAEVALIDKDQIEDLIAARHEMGMPVEEWYRIIRACGFESPEAVTVPCFKDVMALIRKGDAAE